MMTGAKMAIWLAVVLPSDGRPYVTPKRMTLPACQQLVTRAILHHPTWIGGCVPPSWSPYRMIVIQKPTRS